MADPLWIHTRVAFAGEFHQVDAAARGIHFFVPENVGGTDRQAETAVDAVLDDLFGRRMVRVEGAWQRIGFGKVVMKERCSLPLVNITEWRCCWQTAIAGRKRKKRKRKDNSENTESRRGGKSFGRRRSGLAEIFDVFKDCDDERFDDGLAFFACGERGIAPSACR